MSEQSQTSADSLEDFERRIKFKIYLESRYCTEFNIPTSL